MIIQAGFDLQILAYPHVVQGSTVLPRIVAVGLDAEMRLDIVTVVTDDFSGSLTPHFNEILDALRHQETKYFAIAHAGCWPENWEQTEPILVEAETLKALAKAELGLEMIGHFGMDEDGYTCSGPHSYFDGYYNLLPETEFHWCHSTLGKCN
ncbi:hypothetical protein ACIPY3_20625 [Paenarthrobacter sp. NPDC089714]|uniref:hypothetical protein n=1 Tax=Paenarthrobacter sp. NPDC089714 TaxID=3364377 RepID=UPI003809BE28